MAVSSRTTASPMSTVSSRSSSSGGSGTIISPTIAMMAPGARSCAARWPRVKGRRIAVADCAISEHQLLEADQVRQHFGDRLEERARNHVADFGLGVEGARERYVLDHRDAVIAGDRLHALRHVAL